MNILYVILIVVASVLACWGFARFVDWFIYEPAGNLHWVSEAEPVSIDDVPNPDLRWLGQDEQGRWWVGNDDGWERWNPKSISHLAAYRRSWSSDIIVWLETVS